MIINNFDPVAIEIFSLEIRWYSLAYIIGILLGWYLAKKVFIYNGIKDRFDDFVTYVIISSILFSRKDKEDVYKYLDIIALISPIGILFGRIANFINSELYGLETSVPWAVKFVKIDNLYRHPSQLYEATFEGIVLFLILIYFWTKGYLNTPGKLSALFLIFYSVFRFIIEYFRLPDEQLGYLILNLTMGQLLSFLFFITGVSIFYLKDDTKKRS